MTNSKETRRLPRAEATRSFDPDLAEMRVDLPGLGLMTYFPRLFLAQASPYPLFRNNRGCDFATALSEMRLQEGCVCPFQGKQRAKFSD